MSVRSLDILDLPTLHHYRNEVLGFDTARSLTRGNPLSGLSLVSHVVSPTRDSYAAIAEDHGEQLMGGVYRTHGESFARLLYIAPASRLDHRELPGLLENLITQVGGWGAFHLVAEVDETSDAFIALRQAGFSVYAWQRMWDVSEVEPDPAMGTWERASSANMAAVQRLYQQIVPPLIQPVEQVPGRHAGYICTDGANCYADYISGAYGIALNPLIHPEAQNVDIRLMGLLNSLKDRRSRKVYICVRSYQVWLENVLADLGASYGPRQALMVRHLAHLLKDEQVVRAKQPAGVSVPASRVSRIQK